MQTPVAHANEEVFFKTVRNLKAIAHPIRLAILSLLQDGQKLNVTQIYKTLNLEQAVASQHLSILRQKKILATQRQGKNTFYFLQNPSIIKALYLISASEENVWSKN